MAESATGADIVHPSDERMSQSVGTLRTALLADGYSAAQLSSMTKNDMVYADDLGLGLVAAEDQLDFPEPRLQCTGAEEVSGDAAILTPTGCKRPTLAELTAFVTADPATAWDEDSHVACYNGEQAYWDGNSWEDGVAPA